MKVLNDLQEHKKIENLNEYLISKNIDNIDEVKEKIIKNEEKLKNYDIKVNNNSLEIGYYVGLCTIDDIIIKINPKFNNNNIKINIMKMMQECLNDKIVSLHLSECYKIYYNEPHVKIDNNIFSDLYLFVIQRYIAVLKDTIKHGLYKSFYKEENILKGKIKGKLLINKTNNIHLKENVKLKNKCIYETHDINNIENQILKYALKKAEIYSLERKYNDLYRNICMLKEKFNNVENRIIKEIDFKKINKKIINKGYKESLNIAYEVIKILDKNIYVEGKEEKIYPFYINLPELFERYCEVKLRKYIPSLKAGYTKGDKESQIKTGALRPDFAIPKNINEKIDAYILDSKYSIKYNHIFEQINKGKKEINEKTGDIKDHLQQLSLYSRTKEFQKQLTVENSSDIKLCIIFPILKEENQEIAEEITIQDAKLLYNSYRIYPSTKYEEIYYMPLEIPYNK